jgi:hypothetical protein
MLVDEQPSQTEYVLLWIKYPLTRLWNSFWFQSTQQYIILLYGDSDMFWSLDQHQSIFTNLILTFCKDGLMMVKWLKQIVIQIKYNNILLCWLKLEIILLSCNLITQRHVLFKKKNLCFMNTVISQPVPKWNSSINVVFRMILYTER